MHGESLQAARTVAVNVFVFGQLMYLFNCRSLRYSMFYVGVFSNPKLLFGVVCMSVLQLLFTYWQPMQIAFDTAPIGVEEWLLISVVSLSIYSIIGLEKLILRQFNR
jgi:Ca2+-transporting ATPase